MNASVSPRDEITVVHCADEGAFATKVITPTASGGYDVKGFNAGKHFTSAVHGVSSIRDVAAVLDVATTDPCAFVIPGEPVPGVDHSKPHRRLKHDKEDSPATYRERESHMVLVDLDKVAIPDGCPLTEPEPMVRSIIARDLPELDGVTCWWQLSSSAGLAGDNTVSVHIAYFADRALSNDALKAWAKTHNARMGRKVLDPAVYSAVQPFFTAAPVFADGAVDPIAIRSGLLKGETDVATFPSPSTADTFDGIGDAELESARGYEAIMATLGDGPGLNGFHEPIRDAICSYVGTGREDFALLKADIRSRIDKAPKNEGRDVSVEKSDEELDRLIDGALAVVHTRAGAEGVTAIARAWRATDPGLLLTPPPARKWLLLRPSEDGIFGAQGDGVLPLGKCGLLSADGGLGKTGSLVALAESIVVEGYPWLGHFEIGAEARGKRVLLVLAEEDREEIHRKLYTVAEAYGLSEEERRLVAERVVVVGLAGQPVSLLRDGQDSHELIALRELLRTNAGENGWALIVLDPLVRMGDDDTEKDNSAATRLVQAAESLSEAPGGPTVLVAHHVAKNVVGTALVTARGVTGLRNGVRWEGRFRAEDGRVFFQQTKSNYSRPMTDELELVRGEGGILRVRTPEEVGQQTADQLAEASRAVDEDIARVVDALCREGELGSIDAIASAAGMRLQKGRAAVHIAIGRGLIVQRGTTRSRRFNAKRLEGGS